MPKKPDVWRGGIAAAAIKINGKIESAYQPEPNPAEVIGDVAVRRVHLVRQKQCPGLRHGKKVDPGGCAKAKIEGVLNKQ